MPYSDVYMLAKAKNRLNDIFKIYTILKDNNLKPNLLLAGVDIQDQKYKDEITYLNKSIPYEENLQYIFHTHCILEVMQKNGIGFTQRACEAVCLGKKLLTNNPHIKNEPFFNLEYISTFTSPNDIDSDFLKKIKDPIDINYHYKEKMSPIELLNLIENYL